MYGPHQVILFIDKLAIKFSGEHTAILMAKSSPYLLTLLKNDNFHFRTELSFETAQPVSQFFGLSDLY